jgi:hypothetical protein
MARFSFPSMRVQNKGGLLAFFSVVDHELGIQFNDMVLFQTGDGSRQFVKPPYREYTKVGEKEASRMEYFRAAWVDNAWSPAGKKYFDDIAAAAHAAYKGAGEGSAPPQGAKKATKQSGRGPVKASKPMSTALEDDDYDLPF